MPLRICTGKFNIVVKYTKMCYFIFFPGKITLRESFLGSGLKSIFHWYTHWEIKLRSIFKYLADSLRSWKKIKKWCIIGKQFSNETELIRQVINNALKTGSRMNLCGTSLRGSRLDSLLFNNTLWNLLEK